MASCMGGDGGRKAFTELVLALLKAVATCGLASVLIVHQWPSQSSQPVELRVDQQSALAYLALAVVVSPLCWGFFAFFKRFLSRQSEQPFVILFSAVSSALVTIHLLPGFIFHLLFAFFGLVEYFVE